MYLLTKGIRTLPLSIFFLLLLLGAIHATSALKVLPLNVNLETTKLDGTEEYYGLTLPPNIIRGVPFVLSYRLRNELSGPTFSFVQYGMDRVSLARYPSLGLPAFVRADGQSDTSSSLLDRITGGTFNLTLSMPTVEEDGLKGYIQGETLFSMALYGVVGGRMDPVVQWVNQTTLVFPTP